LAKEIAEYVAFIEEIIMDESENGSLKRDDLQAYLRKHNLSGSMLIIARKG
jgi:hypothetical protein